jgi:phosphatidylserine synthase
MTAPRKGASWRSKYLTVAGLLVGAGSLFVIARGQDEAALFWLLLITGIGMSASGILMAREERRRNGHKD